MSQGTQRTLAECIHDQAPLAVATSASVLDAAQLMAERRCGSVLVVSVDKALIGIFTERDLLVKVVAPSRDPATTRIADVMTPGPRTALPTMPVSHALVLMRDGGFRHLPVVDEHDRILGIFSIRDTLTSELIDADVITAHQEQLGAVL